MIFIGLHKVLDIKLYTFTSSYEYIYWERGLDFIIGVDLQDVSRNSNIGASALGSISYENLPRTRLLVHALQPNNLIGFKLLT